LKILRAATELFDEEGYTGTRMTDVARRAQVAVQTVYFVFHTKPELLQACFDLAVTGEEGVPPPMRPFWRELRETTAASEAIRIFVRGNGEIASRAAKLDNAVRGALHEPEAAAVLAKNEGLRRDGFANIIAHLDERFGLRPGLGRDVATDILMVIAGPQVYRSFVSDYGWTFDDYVDRVSRTLAAAIIGPEQRDDR
jgi:AcrR family transcriptional regulator